MTLAASQCDNCAGPPLDSRPRTEAKDSRTDGPSQTHSDRDSIKSARAVVMRRRHAGPGFHKHLSRSESSMGRGVLCYLNSHICFMQL